MRWVHEGVDRLYIAFMHRLLPPVFRRGITSPPLSGHLAAVDLSVPPLTAGPRRYSLPARTLVGDLQAGFTVRPASRASSPVLIYHHGLGEIPYDHTFRLIFRRPMPADAHLIAIRAPFHRNHVDCCRGLATLSSFMAMCAVSVALIEAVRLAFVARGAQGAIVAGTSLGGFIALLHHLTYGTAGCYAPLFAGPDLGATLLTTPCRQFLARQARADPAELSACLDFRAAFRASDARRVFPLLGRHDLWMPCGHHMAAYAANGVPVALIDRGHMTGSWAFAAMRDHLLACLQRASDAPTGHPMPVRGMCHGG